jgi:hypothetical protein
VQAAVLAAGWAEAEVDALAVAALVAAALVAAALVAGALVAAALVAGALVVAELLVELLELLDEQPAARRLAPTTQIDAVTDMRNRTKCLRRS